jgi:hypothetical protein
MTSLFVLFLSCTPPAAPEYARGSGPMSVGTEIQPGGSDDPGPSDDSGNSEPADTGDTGHEQR